MKELYRTKKMSLGVYDDAQFYLADIVISQGEKTKGEERLDNMKYYVHLDLAIKKMADSVAKIEAEDLRSYLKSLRQTYKDLKELVSITPEGNE